MGCALLVPYTVKMPNFSSIGSWKEESKTMNYFIRSVISAPRPLWFLGFLPNEMRQLHVVEALPLDRSELSWVKPTSHHLWAVQPCASHFDLGQTHLLLSFLWASISSSKWWVLSFHRIGEDERDSPLLEKQLAKGVDTCILLSPCVPNYKLSWPFDLSHFCSYLIAN